MAARIDITCPSCWAASLLRVVYGFPGGSLMMAAERGEVILGGCDLPLVSEPVVACPQCGWQATLRRGRITPIEEAWRIAATDLGVDGVVRRRADLLRINEVDNLRILADMCVDAHLDGELRIVPQKAPFSSGISLSYTSGWFDQYRFHHVLYYPFTNEQFWSVVSDMGDLDRFATEVDGIADDISMIEGFEVQIHVMEEPLPSSTLTTFGLPIHDVPRYPFKRAMSEDATVREWRTKRFDRYFPGFSATIVFQDAEGLQVVAGDRMKLRTIRRRHHTKPPAYSAVSQAQIEAFLAILEEQTERTSPPSFGSS